MNQSFPRYFFIQETLVIAQIMTYVGASVLIKAIGFVITVWVARVLSIEEFGYWGLMYAFQTGAAMFASVGIAEVTAGRFRSLHATEDRQFLFAGAQHAFIVTGSVVLLAGLGLRALLPVFEQLDGLTACLLAGVLIGFGTLQAQLLRLDERHNDSVYFVFLVPLAAWLGGATGLGVFSNIAAFYWVSVVTMSLLLSISWRRMLGVGVGVVPVDSTMSIARGIYPYAIVSIVGWLCGYGNNFIIIMLFDSYEVAKFTFLLAIGSVIQIASTSMSQVWTPRFIHMSNDRPSEEVEDAAYRFFLMQSIIMGTCIVIAVALVPWILELMGGNLGFYADARVEMFLVMVAYIVLIPWWHCYNHLIYHGQGKSIMAVTVGVSAVGIGLWILLMKLLGSIGIYLGFFAQLLIMSIGISIYTQRRFVVRVPWASALVGILIASGGYILTA